MADASGSTGRALGLNSKPCRASYKMKMPPRRRHFHFVAGTGLSAFGGCNLRVMSPTRLPIWNSIGGQASYSAFGGPKVSSFPDGLHPAMFVFNHSRPMPLFSHFSRRIASDRVGYSSVWITFQPVPCFV